MKNLLLSRKAITKMQAIVIAVIVVVVASIGGAVYYLTMLRPPALAPTPTSTPTLTPTGKVYEVAGLKDLLNLAPQMSYKWMDSNGTQMVVTYKTIREETVEGVTCWIVESSITTDDKKDIFTVWVSKKDGVAQKIKVGEAELTGVMAEQIWGGLRVAVMLPFVIGSSWRIWEIPYITDPAYGTVQYLGSESRTYGETTLTVGQYRFTSGKSWYQVDLDYMDYSLVNIDAYMLMTYFKYTLKNGQWGSFELQTIKLY